MDDLIDDLQTWAESLREAFKKGTIATDEPAIVMDNSAARIAALEADNARLMGLVKEAGEALKAIQQRHGWCAGRCRACEKAATTLAKLKETTDG